MRSLPPFARIIADATAALGEPTFAETLSIGVKDWIGADDISLIRYLDTGVPVVEYTLPPKRRGTTTLERYVDGPFLLDPFYRALELDKRYGVFQLSTLAPKGFKESEYFRTWYHECGFQDECGVLIKLNHGSINLALGMTEGSRRFSKRQVEKLEAVFPAIEALVRKHWSAASTSQPEQADFRQRLQYALGAFGASVLTRREREVIELVLLGHSTRLVAEKLRISTETVKLHRKHAYAKLDISSQAELFYLFVDAIASHAGAPHEDPLLGYHETTQRGKS
jgi:DNA-binding CsgD family transcriptional regulator